MRRGASWVEAQPATEPVSIGPKLRRSARWEPQQLGSAVLAVYFPAVSHPNNADQNHGVLNLIDDAIIADADAV